PLKVEVWYPAVIPAGKTEETVYVSPMVGRAPRAGMAKTFNIAGKALRDAPAVSGERFPLVVVSHGYPGSRTLLSYFTEDLACWRVRERVIARRRWRRSSCRADTFLFERRAIRLTTPCIGIT